MTSLLERIHEIGTRAWLRFVQALNWIMISVAGSVIVVHETYPQVISGAVGKMPPWLGIPAIFAFGLLVHYALRRAKASPNE
jgi:hypothetical protein